MLAFAGLFTALMIVYAVFYPEREERVGMLSQVGYPIAVIVLAPLLSGLFFSLGVFGQAG